ncbi:hypothetical protein [Methylomonas koyamae]|nr:hypothetical protein [Methylomonas koyamae]ATG91039.1 hypothetical protein MKLM6_2833 [Methylomonas koyamae]
MAMHDQGHSAANDEFSLRRLLVAAPLTVGNAVVWLTHDRLVAAEIDKPRLTDASAVGEPIADTYFRDGRAAGNTIMKAPRTGFDAASATQPACWRS